MRKYIESLFPELNEIKETSIREGVVKVWFLAMERGGWKMIDDIPFTILIPTKISLIEHIRKVTQMAIGVARARDDLNVDFLIAGGLIHDVGKLLEYEKKKGKIVKSKFGKFVRHPISGYALALEAGLPWEVAHIVLAHSEDVMKISRIKEATVIYHCDFIEFEIEKERI